MTQHTLTFQEYEPRSICRALNAYLRNHRYTNIADLKRLVKSPRGTKKTILNIAARLKKLHNEAFFSEPLDLQQRLEKRLIKKLLDEAEKRRLQMPEGSDPSLYFLIDRIKHIWLIGGEWSYRYDNGKTYTVTGYFVGGYDEGQLWCCRIPCNAATSISAALEYITPPQCRQVRPNQKLIRQGDVFFLGTPAKKCKFIGESNLPPSHIVKPRKNGGFTVTHRQHKAVVLSKKYRWRAYAGTQLHGRFAD